jgi:hypothetical protein
MRRGVEQHHGTTKDFVPLYLLGHLAGTVGLPPELVSGVHPFLTRLNSSKNEVRRHTNSINHFVIQQS